MLEPGDAAPTFSATRGTSDHEPFELEDAVGDGPVVLAFFPGAFTPPCTNGEAIRAYGVEFDIEELGLHGIANRAVFVLDEDGTVTYSWIADDPTNEPDYDELLDAVRSA